MDGLGWDLRNETIVPPCMWGNQYDSFSEANADYSAISDTAKLDEALFSSSLELQGIQACETNTDFDEVGQMVEMLAPAFDSINNSLELDLLQGQEVMRLASNSMESGAETTWGEALPSQICSIPSIIKTDMMNPSDQFFTNIGHEEDGVLSTIFSRSENIQNLSCSGNVSSGESEDQSYYWMNQGVEHHCSNPFEDSSQRSLRSKPNSKRKIEESCLSSDILQSSSSTSEGGFQINFKNPFKMKKPRSENHSSSSTIDFRQEIDYEPDTEAMAQVKEMIYRAAALRPVSLCVDETVEKSRRKNVRISSDPQTVAARHRRERISEKLRVLQRLVPGGSKMDTASMLDEAASYLKFLKSQVSVLETLGSATVPFPTPFNQPFPMQTLFPPL